MKELREFFRWASMIVFVIGLLILTRTYDVPWWKAFLIITTPAIFSYLQGVAENLRKDETKKR
jgi:hypothetical protein